MPALKTTSLRDVFVRCQDGIHYHDKLCDKLSKIFNQREFESFWEDFLYHLKYCFEYLTREPAVERMIDFVVKFVTLMARRDNSDNTNVEVSSGCVDDTQPRGSELLLKLINFLLKHHNYEDSVRFRCCQLINKLLGNLGDDAEIDEELYEQIYAAMLERLRDLLPAVRVQAVYALARLQDPRDSDCPVIKAFLVMLYDPNTEVRKAVVSTIAPSRTTLTEILKRTRDTSDAVRKQAYLAIAEKVHVKSLAISDRVKLLQDGLNDRAESVKETCSSKLLQAWLLSYSGNVLELLQCLDVETSVAVCKQALVTMFKVTPVTELVNNFDILNEKRLVDVDKLTAASAFYWLNVCDYLHSLLPTTGDQFDQIMPDCMQFCDYLMQYTEDMKQTHDPTGETEPDEDAMILELQQTFVCEQLIRITSLFEFSDLAISKRMKTMYHDLLLKDCIDYTLVEHIISRVVLLRRETTELITYVAETVADIREPITVVEKSVEEEERRRIDLKMAAIRVEMNQTKEEMEAAVLEQDFTKAGTLKERLGELEDERDRMLECLESGKEEVRTEKNDALTLMKCLSIVKELLVHINIGSINPTLRTISESLILPCILRSEVKVRDLAISCLGIFCLISKEFALQYLVLLIQVTQVDHDRVRVTGLRALFDILFVYGMAILESDVAEARRDDEIGEVNAGAEEGAEGEGATTKGDVEKTTENIVAILVSMLDSENPDIRTVSAEGLAKLLLAGRILSAKLFSRLVLLWYNPVSEDDARLRHCLAEFFPLFAMAATSGGGYENQEIVQEAFVLSLKTLFEAPASSPLSAVDADHLSNVFVGLTSAQMLAEKRGLHARMLADHTIHNELAITLCNHILSDPHSLHVRVLTNALRSLDLNPQNPLHMHDIHVLTSQIVEVVRDKKVSKILEKFHAHVAHLIKPSESSTSAGDATETRLSKESGSSVGRNEDGENAADDGGNSGDEVFAENNPAELYRTMIEDANKSGSLQSRSSSKSQTSLSNLASEKVDNEAHEPNLSRLGSQLAASLLISAQPPSSHE